MLSIGILGTGAIGSLMAYHWQQQHLFYLPKNIKAQPLTLHITPKALAQNTCTLRLPAWQGEPLDWLVVCTKAAHTLSALKNWRALLPSVSNLLLIQNGMGQQQLIQDYLTAEGLNIPLWAGMCTEGAFRDQEHTIYAGVGTTIIGLWSAESAPKTMPALPPKLEPTNDIATLLRQKLAINAVINPLTGHLGCLNGELVHQPRHLALLRELSAEVSALYHALQWPLAQPLAEHAQAVALATANNRSSTLQDIQAQRPTELAFISGYLLEQAATLNHPMPLTHELFTQLSNQLPTQLST